MDDYYYNYSNSRPGLDSEISNEIKLDDVVHVSSSSTSKRRKVDQKSVVKVKIEASEGPPLPSDSWSWRKYGQKPIKGSPYPRGYYRCSRSKGCSAKKQVERSRTDASILIITYISTHNHNPAVGPKQLLTTSTTVHLDDDDDHHHHPPPSPKQEQPQQHHGDDGDEKEEEEEEEEDASDQEIALNQENQENPFVSLVSENIFCESHSILLDADPLSYRHDNHLTDITSLKSSSSEDNAFYDELEELIIPTSSSPFTSFTNLFDERILV